MAFSRLLIIGLILVLLIPLSSILLSVFAEPDLETWHILTTYLLKDYIVNSLVLVIGTSFVALILGVFSAYFVVEFNFPGRSLIEGMLFLPLALPGFVVAYSYSGLFDFSGPLATLGRDYFPNSEFYSTLLGLINVKSMAGGIFVLGFILYPYVYLFCRASFIEQGYSLKEVAKSQGSKERATFFKITLPLARPAIITGLSLVMMEVLSDYGTVEYLGIPTFTLAIVKTWFNLNSESVALQLALILVLFVCVVLVFERFSRSQIRFFLSRQRFDQVSRRDLSVSLRIFVMLLCMIPLLFGLIIPFCVLIYSTIKSKHLIFDSSIYIISANTIMLAVISAFIVVVISMFLAFAKILKPNYLNTLAFRLASLGYAIPGVVVAIGVLIPFLFFDKFLNSIFDTRLIFSGSIFILIFSYLIRFLSVGVQGIETGFEKITPSIEDVSLLSKRSVAFRMRKIYYYLLKPSLLTALLIVIVDVAKELPATLILRPLNFNTLAIRTHELAMQERLVESGFSSLLLVIICIIPMIFIINKTQR